MTAQDILAELEAQGIDKTRRIYLRHGAQEKVFGASFGAIDTLAKVLKKQPAAQEAAQELWDSGYMEARAVAIQVADPERCDAEVLKSWAAGMSSHMDADHLAQLAASAKDGPKMATQWLKSKDENTLRLALSTIGHLLKNGTPPRAPQLRTLLTRIEKEIHRQSDFIKEAMNYVVIAIGTYSEALREETLAAARRIGTVNIDHGETNCKTPEAVSYIKKSVAHLEAQASKG